MRSCIPFLTILLGAVSLYGQNYTPQGYVPQGYMPEGYGAAPAPGSGMSATATPYYANDPSYAAPSTYGSVAPAAVGATALDYGLLEGFYQYTTFKNEGIDASHGIGLSLMAELFQPFFLRGSFNWSAGNGQDAPEGYNFSSISIGGGGYFAMSDRFHLVAEVGGLYASLNADSSAVNFSDGAIYIRPWLRYAATDALELQAGIMATSSDSYNTRVYDIGAYYKLFSQMDVGLGAGFGDAQTGYRAGVRFRW